MTIKVKHVSTAITAPGSGYKPGDIVGIGVDKEIQYEPIDSAPTDPFNPATTSIVYGNGMFVRVGEVGLISYSSDAVVWTRIPEYMVASAHQFTGVTFGNGKFVAVTKGGYSLTSTDAFSWTVSAQSTESFTAITFGNGVFVATNDVGDAFTSVDGTAWKAVSVKAHTKIHSITYGNGQFVIVGEKGLVATSPSGLVWTDRSVSDLYELFSVTFALNKFVAVGSAIYAGAIITSSDAVTWSQNQTTSTSTLYGVSANDTTFIAVGAAGSILTSTDGAQWAKAESVGIDLNCVTFGGGKTVIAGEANYTLSSTTSANWVYSLRKSSLGDFKKVVNGQFGTMVAIDSAGLLVTSFDGINWTSVRKGPQIGVELASYAINDIAFGNGVYVVVGNNGGVGVSADLINWTTPTSGKTVALTSIEFGNGMFVAMGDNSTVIKSTDGVVWSAFWTPVTAADSNQDANKITAVDMAYGTPGYVAISSDNSLSFSKDGVAYFSNKKVVPEGNTLTRVIFGERYVAIGPQNVVTSTDGLTWVSAVVPAGTFRDVAYKSGTYVITGDGGLALYSTDGITWSQGTGFDPQFNMTKVKAAGSFFFSAGVSGKVGMMSYSADGITWIGSNVTITQNTYDATVANLVVDTTNSYVWTLFVSVAPWNKESGGLLSCNFTSPNGGFASYSLPGATGEIVNTESQTNVPVQWWRTIDIAISSGRLVLLMHKAVRHFRGEADNYSDYGIVSSGVFSYKSTSAVTLGTTNNPLISHGSVGESALVSDWSWGYDFNVHGYLNHMIGTNSAVLITGKDGKVFSAALNAAGGTSVAWALDTGTGTTSKAGIQFLNNQFWAYAPDDTIRTRGLGNNSAGTKVWNQFSTPYKTDALTAKALTLKSVTFMLDRFVFGSTKGQAMVYTTEWQNTATGLSSDIVGGAYHNGKFNVLGADAKLASSADFSAWAVQTLPATGINTIKNVNGNLAIVGNAGGFQTSTDGVTWTARNAGLTHDGLNNTTFAGALYDVEWNSTLARYTVVGAGSVVATATNLASFEYNILNNDKLRGIGVDNQSGAFWAFSNANYGMLSSNGSNWTRSGGWYAPTANAYMQTTDGSFLTLAVGKNGSIYTSNDLVTWADRSSPILSELRAVVKGPAGFIAVGSGNTIFKSTDAINWVIPTPTPWVTNDSGINVAYSSAPGSITLLGNNGYTKTSENKGNWWYGAGSDAHGPHYLNYFKSTETGESFTSSSTGNFPGTATDVLIYNSSVAYGKGVYAVVGALGKFSTSPDGTVFTGRANFTNKNLNSIVFNSVSGLFVVVGDDGFVATSPNTMKWTVRSSNVTQNLRKIIWTGSIYVAVGAQGKIITSPDAITWTAQASHVSTELRDVIMTTIAGAKLVAVGHGGAITVSSSATGDVWQKVTVSSTGDLRACAFDGTCVVAAGDGILRSVDCVTWTVPTEPRDLPNVPFTDAIYNAKTGKYTVMNSTSAYSSTNGADWSITTIPNVQKLLTLSAGPALSNEKTGKRMLMAPEVGVNGLVTSVNATGGVTAVSAQASATSANFAEFVGGVYEVSQTTKTEAVNLNKSSLQYVHSGRVMTMAMANGARLQMAGAPSKYMGQFGFRTFDSDLTGAKLLVASKAVDESVVLNAKPASERLMNFNLESIPSGNGIGRMVSFSTFPRKVDASLTHVAAKTNLVDTATGAVEFEFPVEFAKMSDDGNMVVGYARGVGFAGSVQVYVKSNGAWSMVKELPANDATDIAFASTSKNVIAVKSTANVTVFKDSGSGFSATPFAVMGNERYDFAWTRPSDNQAFVHGVQVVYSALAPYGNLHVSKDGLYLCTMAMSLKKTGGSYAELDNDNFSPYPTIFSIGSSFSVVRPAWIDHSATHQGKTFKLSSDQVPGVNFYNGDYSCFTYDIKPDFTTLMFPSKPNAAGDRVIWIHTTDRPNGVMSDVGLTAVYHLSTLISETYYPIKIRPVGTRYSLGGVDLNGRGWLRVQGIISEVSSFAARTSFGTMRYAMSSTFSKNGDTLFTGEPMYNNVSSGVGSVASYRWAIYSWIPSDRGENIETMTVKFVGGSPVVPCPDQVMHGVGYAQKVTSLWPYFATGQGGVYAKPSTLNINIISST